MKGIGLLVASVAVIGMSACRDRQGQLQQDRTTVRDSAGTAIVVNRASAEMTDWRLAPTPERVIGDPEAHPVAQLFRAYSATRTGTGDIVIGNSGTSQILVVTKDGSLLAAFGRRGRGPGEFGGMARVIASDADAILIEDLGLQRKLLRFTLTGELVEEVVLPTRVIFRGGAWSDPAASPAGVEFILAEPLDAPNLGRVTRPQRGPLFVVRFTYHGDGPDTLATYPGTELFNADVGPQPAFGGGTASGPRSVAPLFGSKTRLAGGGTPWRAVVADQARASYDVFGEDGSLVRRVQWQATGRVPTSRDITLAREEFVRSRRQDPAGARRSLNVMPPVEETPVLDQLMVGRDNRVWVRAYALPTDAAAQWWVFSEEGVLIATLNIPREAQVLEIGDDYVLTRMMDDLDVERIELWPIQRGN